MIGGRRERARLETRLVTGSLAVIVTALGVTWAVATVAGPPLFRAHVTEGRALPPELLDRVEQAFHIANLLQFLLASGLALLLAVLASLLMTRSIGHSVLAMAQAARQIADGDYGVRIPARQAARELDALACAFNDMAARIQQTEATRRRMLTDLAHEMRTPLATVDGYLEAIDDGVATADEATITLLRDQVRRLTRLADDVYAISAADEGRLRLHRDRTTVRVVVDAAIATARPGYADKGVELHAASVADATFEVDPVRIGQVLANVLNNALRHTPSGGRVEIAASTDPGHVHITVEDNGEGIAPDHLPHLFERFYRAHRAHGYLGQGSGVGLTISRAIVAAHGGRITVDSPGVGAGTTVRITLPRAAG